MEQTLSTTLTSKKWFFNAFVFTTGAAVMLLEFAASRLMAPWFGTSIFVWGNIIGVIFIALSAGYYFGGKLADKQPRVERLFDIVWLAGVICSIIPLVAYLITSQIGAISLQASSTLIQTVVGSFIVVLFLFAVPIMLLGMVSPFVIRLATTSVDKAGQVAGGLYAASTIGSIIGTFASAFLIVPLLGSRETILLSASILIIVSAIASKKRWRRLAVLVIPIVVYAIFSGSLVRVDAGVIYEEESLYQYIQVSEGTDRLYLSYNEGLGTQSFFMKEGVLTGGYFDYMNLVPLMANFPEDAHVGVLGLAGGTATRQLRHYYPNYRLSGVEIDGTVVEIANEYFELEEQDVAITIADGRMFMRNTEDTYDMVLIDAFSDEIYIPWHLTTREFFIDIKDNLTPDGVVAFNVGSTSEDSLLLSSMIATLQESFSEVYVYPVPKTFNNVVLATNTPLNAEPLLEVEGELATLADSFYSNLTQPEPSTATVLTDNRAPIEVYTESMIARFIFDTL